MKFLGKLTVTLTFAVHILDIFAKEQSSILKLGNELKPFQDCSVNIVLNQVQTEVRSKN